VLVLLCFHLQFLLLQLVSLNPQMLVILSLTLKYRTYAGTVTLTEDSGEQILSEREEQNEEQNVSRICWSDRAIYP
jgi:hypothetical protein